MKPTDDRREGIVFFNVFFMSKYSKYKTYPAAQTTCESFRWESASSACYALQEIWVAMSQNWRLGGLIQQSALNTIKSVKKEKDNLP